MAAHSQGTRTIPPVPADQPPTGWSQWLREMAQAINLMSNWVGTATAPGEGGSGGTGSGTVTSVTAGAGLVGAPNPITGAGTLSLSVPVTVARGGTGAVSHNVDAVLVGAGTAALRSSPASIDAFGNVFSPLAYFASGAGADGGFWWLQGAPNWWGWYAEAGTARLTRWVDGSITVDDALTVSFDDGTISAPGDFVGRSFSTDTPGITGGFWWTHGVAGEWWALYGESGAAHLARWSSGVAQGDALTINFASRAITAPGSLTAGTATAPAGGTLAGDINGQRVMVNGVPVGGGGGGSGTVTSVAAGTGLAASPSPIVGAGTLSLVVPVTIANGGTAATTVTNARTNLGAAPIASPAFTGSPTAPTAASSSDSTQIATTAFVKSLDYAPLFSPAFTGAPTAPTPLSSSNSTQIATTAFVKDYAPLASPALTGAPTAPTPISSSNSTQIATTAFVKSLNYLTANQTITLSGDVTGSGTAAIAATVARLQGRALAATAPTTNQVIGWNGTTWLPVTPTNLAVTLPLGVANGGSGVNTAAAAPWVTVVGDTMTGSLDLTGAYDPTTHLSLSRLRFNGRDFAADYLLGAYRYQVLFDASGNGSFYLGDATDPSNYYQQTFHGFYDRPGTTEFASFSAAGANIAGNTNIAGYLRLGSQFLYLGGGTGSVNTVGGPLIYGDANYLILKPGSGNFGVSFQAYDGSSVATVSPGNGFELNSGYYYHNGTIVLHCDAPNTGHNKFYTNDGTTASILSGGTNDRTNYYRNTTHAIQPLNGASTWATVGPGVMVGAPTGGMPVSAGQLNAVQVRANNVVLTSDADYKSDIATLPECLPLIRAVEPKSYKWKPLDEPEGGPSDFAERRHWGLLAQEVHAAMDQAGYGGGIREEDNGVLGLGVGGLVATLWQAVRELSAEVDALKRRD